MHKENDPVPEIYVHPGESHLVKAPTLMRTLLGSCVGITFLIPRLNVGALCHPMLPNYSVQRARGRGAEAGCRYVDYAIRNLAQQFDALGAVRSEVQVKLFGGGDVLKVESHRTQPTVGMLNSETALRVLEEEGFKIKISKLGGTTGMNIQFHTGTGEVLLRWLG